MQAPPFGELLKRLRVAAGLSQEALAERARMSAHAISSLERGARRAPYRDTVALLQDGLALGPSDRALLDASAEQGRKRAPRGVASPAHDGPAHNLPAQLTSFVGRERDVEDIQALLASNRLVTVTGAGGIGKTRVALEVSARMDGAWADGMWFVDLAPLADGTLVAARIASAAGVLAEDDSPATLAAALHGRSMLLVIDNCEHVISAVEAVTVVLVQACPRLAVLATSRERLGVAGEAAYRLAPLPAPSAVDLFVQRSGASLSRTSGEPLELVAAICRRLDGIPLAIELAAARVPALGLSGLRDRLDEHFKILSRGSRGAPARQQTMQAAISWSYELLSASERALFRRLAIFAGGWRLEAAETVCAGDGIAALEVVDILASLIEKSLVVADDNGHFVRYGFLESTRAFALEQLIASGERPALAAAHARWMSLFADWAYEEYHHIPPGRWSEFVAPELDNAYAALGWAHGDGDDIRLAARILAGLRGAFTDSAGSLTEFNDWVTRAIARIGPDTDPALHAHLLRALMAVSRGPELIATSERAVELFTRVDEVFGLGRSLELLASGYVESGEFEKAAAAVDRSLLLYRGRGLGRSTAYAVALDTRANVFHHQRRFDEAERDQAEALSIAQAQEDDWFALHLQIGRAAVALTANEPGRAAALAESALAESRALRSPRYEMYALVNLAGARLALDDLSGAHEAALAALGLARSRDAISATVSMLYIATIAGLQGRLRAAARLLGYVDAWAASGFRWGETEAACRERLVAVLEAELAAELIAADMAIGAHFDDEAAAEEALRA
jgi:predicted ATPase/transcriptional regulator with XRE-family HTH domain